MLMLPACSISYYKVDNYRLSDSLEMRSSIETSKLHEIRYFVNIISKSKQFAWDQDYREESLQKNKKSFMQVTQTAFEEKGYRALLVDSEEDADYQITIRFSSHMNASSLPQEWLTILSFGIIPSWGTRDSEYVYTFKNRNSGRKNSVVLNRVSFNHLIFLPVYWINTLSLNEINIYAKSLEYFIESS